MTVNCDKIYDMYKFSISMPLGFISLRNIYRFATLILYRESQNTPFGNADFYSFHLEGFEGLYIEAFLKFISFDEISLSDILKCFRSMF